MTKNRKEKTIFKVLTYILLIIGVIFTMIPFVWMFLTSIKSQAESILIPPKVFPDVFRWDNYSILFKRLSFGTFYINTIFITVVTTSLKLFFSSMAAYAFARIEFKFRNFFFALFLAVLFVPGEIFTLPRYLIIQKMGLLNTLTAIILPNLVNAYGIFLLRQFYLTLPKEVEEAAIIDGCNYFQIYYKVMLPLIVPGLVAFGIMEMLFNWNTLLWPLIVNSATNKMTLSAGLAGLIGQANMPFPLLMAGACLAALPMIIVFFIVQKKFIASIAITGTKG